VLTASLPLLIQWLPKRMKARQVVSSPDDVLGASFDGSSSVLIFRFCDVLVCFFYGSSVFVVT
jgi:hypothetical protein